MKPKQIKTVPITESLWISPDEALAEANQESPKRPVGPLASSYAPAVHVLRQQKGLTWEEVREWLSRRGIEFSITALYTSYRKWLKAQARETGDRNA